MSEVIKPFEIFRVSVPDGEYSRRADVVEKLHYDAAQSQLAALREELAEWKARAGRRTNDMGEISSEKLELKQRLADAERRNSNLVELLIKAKLAVDDVAENCEDQTDWATANSMHALSERIDAALNKPEEAKS